MASVAEEESFKITDRRRSGQPVPAEAAAEARAAEPEPPAHAPTASARPEQAEPDLQGLFVMFASSALIALGETPDPMTGEQRMDLEQAKEAIDLLLLLRTKTEGNRTEAESRLLDEILYDLQLRFVRVTKAAAPPRASG